MYDNEKLNKYFKLIKENGIVYGDINKTQKSEILSNIKTVYNKILDLDNGNELLKSLIRAFGGQKSIPKCLNDKLDQDTLSNLDKIFKLVDYDFSGMEYSIFNQELGEKITNSILQLMTRIKETSGKIANDLVEEFNSYKFSEYNLKFLKDNNLLNTTNLDVIKLFCQDDNITYFNSTVLRPQIFDGSKEFDLVEKNINVLLQIFYNLIKAISSTKDQSRQAVENLKNYIEFLPKQENKYESALEILLNNLEPDIKLTDFHYGKQDIELWKTNADYLIKELGCIDYSYNDA